MNKFGESTQSYDGAVNAAELSVAASGVSWGAILAGAAGAAALSLILLILGTGLGLSSVSPWAHDGIEAETLGISSIAWVIFTQLAAAGMGGYLAGRLRIRWTGVDQDEVYFRDTAHGFLAWSVASLATAALLTSVVGSIVSTGAQSGAALVGGAASTATAAGVAIAGTQTTKAKDGGDSMGYFVDSLFRKDFNASAAPMQSTGVDNATAHDADSSAEVARIFIKSVHAGSLPPEDVRYISQVVAQRTGLTQEEAEKRVVETYTRLQTSLQKAEAAVREAADKARKASAHVSLWLFISLLIGAFVASLMATFGGRQRDL